ncbi:MAG: hypothetical protein IIY47_02935 [Solobacterium sp.]|nr:hypothetical protein [Solobacterium sp.]
MIESIENALQIIVLLICSGIALYRAIANHSQTWVLAFLFFGSWLLGDIYWLVCLLFYGQTPQISIVSDLSWYGSYIFLYLLLYHSSAPDKDSRKHRLPWLGPVFAAGMAVFFITQGELLSNLIYASLMGLLLFAALSRKIDRKRYQNQQFLSGMILLFCLLEYGLWTASCFWKTDTLSNPYYWFDFLLTVSFVFFLPAIKKAVTE